jgi:hypothetical protein
MSLVNLTGSALTENALIQSRCENGKSITIKMTPVGVETHITAVKFYKNVCGYTSCSLYKGRDSDGWVYPVLDSGTNQLQRIECP